MELKRYACRNCGAPSLRQDGEIIRCTACGTKFKAEIEINKIKEEMRSLVDEFKQEQVSNLRQQLLEKADAKYIDSDSILEICRDLRTYLPDDFLANFYEVANGGTLEEYAEFLNSIDAEENYSFIERVVNFTVKSLQEPLILPLNHLVERTYHADPDEYDRIMTMVAEEAERVSEGIYDENATRDVFVLYSSRDMAKVMELVRQLEDEGISCFVALRNLQHGRGAKANYQKLLETAMDRAKCVVFVSSRNSRNLSCDAYRIELPHIRKTDKENAPAEYRNQSYDTIPLMYKKPRVEYLIEEYIGKKSIAEGTVIEFFSGLEYCRSVESTKKRISDIILGNVDDFVNTEHIASQIELDTEKMKAEAAKAEAAKAAADAEKARATAEVEKAKAEAEAAKAKAEVEARKAKADAEKAKLEEKNRRERERELRRQNRRNAARARFNRAKKPLLIVFVVAIVVGILAVVITTQGDKIDNLISNVGNGNTAGGGNNGNSNGNNNSGGGIGDFFDDLFNDCEHTYSEWEIWQEPTTTSTGLRVRTCTQCGKSEEETIPKVNHVHKIEQIASVPATCMEYGKTTGAKCSECNQIITAQQPVLMDHKYESGACVYCGTIDLISAGLDISVNGDTCTVTGIGTCTDKRVVIPMIYEGRQVTAIGSGAFKGSDIREIVLHNAITTIGSQAFMNCGSLTDVEMGDGVTDVGTQAFYYCNALTDIELSSSLEKIDGAAFYYCTSLSEITIPAGTNIADDYSVSGSYRGVFESCTSLVKVTIGDENTSKSLTTIGDYAFKNCSALTEVYIGNSVGTIGSCAFIGCGIKNISIGNSVKTIGDSAFHSTDIETVKIPDSVTSMGNAAFMNSSVIEVELGSGLKTIPAQTFYDCTSLETIEIPSTVEKIDGAAFYRCTSLSEITIPTGTNIADDYSVSGSYRGVFENCTSLVKVTIGDENTSKSLTTIGDYAFKNCSALTEVYIGNSVGTIGSCAFIGCGITKLTLGSRVTSISDSAFSGCSKITIIFYLGTKSAWENGGYASVFSASNPVVQYI